VDDRAELVGEAGRFEGGLPVVLVDVELPPCVRESGDTSDAAAGWWWWADPATGYVLVYYAVREGPGDLHAKR